MGPLKCPICGRRLEPGEPCPVGEYADFVMESLRPRDFRLPLESDAEDC